MKKNAHRRPMATVSTRDGDVLTDAQVITPRQRELPDPTRPMATSLASISQRQRIRATSPAPLMQESLLRANADLARRAMAEPVSPSVPEAPLLDDPRVPSDRSVVPLMLAVAFMAGLAAQPAGLAIARLLASWGWL